MPRNLHKAERIEFIDRRLDELYPDPPVPLDHHDPFTLLVAVLLSAQCTDERVLVTPSLFELADNPFDMAERVPIRSAKSLAVRSLASEIKAIRGLSEILIEEHGKVPQDFDALSDFPVGHKTASVVMAQSSVCPARRYAHSPAGSTLGTDTWTQCCRNRARPKNYFAKNAGMTCLRCLWKRILHGARV